MSDLTPTFADRIQDATSKKTPLRFVGGGSKDFYGQSLRGDVLSTQGHRGIVSYEPSELVLTARAGTPISEIEAALAEKGQMLAFEPPQFDADSATLGGVVAAGLSGPRRATAGAVRDFVLGATILDGRAEVQKFGGQVMKNVAGYDVSRLFAGAMGSLGLLLDLSIKVLPKPVAETTLVLERDQVQALTAMNRWAGLPLPISATCWQDGRLAVRLSGAHAAVASAQAELGGTLLENADAFWAGIRHQRAEFFRLKDNELLWRLSLPSITPVQTLPGQPLIEWGGALRWVKAAPDQAGTLRALAEAAGGHATLFKGGTAEQRQAIGVFHPLPPAMKAVQYKLRRVFDPLGLFNPGRLYADF